MSEEREADITLMELREAIGEDGIKNLLVYINKSIKEGIERNIKLGLNKKSEL
ncbi:MAG: hypothetical protein ACRCXT_14425 [Paraclostridium sp.]